LAINALVVVTDDPRNLGIVINLREDPLADRRMLFHLTPLCQRERARFFEQAWRQADLPYVMNESAEVHQSLVRLAESQASSDCTRVCGNRRRMTRRVPISRIKGSDECRREGQVRGFEPFVGYN